MSWNKLAFFLTLPCLIFAQRVQNPSAPKILEEGIFSSCQSRVSFRVNGGGDFITDSRMLQYKGGSGRVDAYRIYSGFASFLCNCFQFLDLFAEAGTSHMQADWRVSILGLTNHIVATSNRGLFLKGGGYLLLYEWEDTTLGFGGSYGRGKAAIHTLSIDGKKKNTTKAKWDLHFWQVNIGISHKIDFLIPYLGAKYSRNRSEIETPYITGIAKDGSSKNHFKNRDKVGLYLGCTITQGKIGWLQIEGRLFDEEAVSISGEVLF